MLAILRSSKCDRSLADLYEFRNIIAHGREIPKTPYRQEYDLLDENGGRINHDDYYHAELMLESGLFLLTEALHKISVESLFDDVRDEAKWRLKLRLYEHRWKNDPTVLTPKSSNHPGVTQFSAIASGSASRRLGGIILPPIPAE